jgi:nicotinate dehydrogenase subunit A
MTQSFEFTVNGKPVSVALANEGTPLLNVLRNELGLMGTRFGCGLEQCGCCTVLIDGKPEKCCAKPVWSVAGKAIVTIEGLGTPEKPHPLQQAFIDEQAAQCGYCTAGMIMRAQALLERDPGASDAAIRRAMEPNLCRCGTHMRILRAIARAGEAMKKAAAGERPEASR